jgi:pimeloyl-ACP methyl ester carboxylesterase
VAWDENAMRAARPHPPRRTWTWAACAVALALAAGCASIRVRRADHPSLLAAWRASAVTSRHLSPRTVQTLRRFDLTEVYARSPAEASVRLHAEALHDPQPDLLFALAEISYQRGRAAEEKSCADATGYYYLCAGYAYHFLFDEYPPPPVPDRPPDPRGDAEVRPAAALNLPPTRSTLQVFDPRFRLACDLYNAGLAKCLVAAQKVGQLDPRYRLCLPTGGGKEFTLSVVHHGFAWQPDEFGELLLCSDFEVLGLANHHRTYGLGVPLIATRAATTPRPAQAHYPANVSFPATAFFRFRGSLAELGQRRAGRLELYNPLAVQSVVVKGRPVPLETDLTTPLAHFLAHARLEASGVAGFLRPDALAGQTGIYTLEPYQPGKIPVVLVHGLLSSPLTWAPVYNDLQADPQLRRRYQFWVYFYPTGNPYLVTAADLRTSLARLRRDLDPQHKDPALDEMVFVGHSMGGLVSRLLTVQGGDDFWRLVSSAPIDRLELQPGGRAELQTAFYFEPVPSVRRVVFLGTPHHGSKLSPSVLGRLAVHLVRLPRTLLAEVGDIADENPQLPLPRPERPLPTSVDLLAPGAPALELLAARSRPPRVHYHSVIGVTPPGVLVMERLLGGGYNETGDGVVPYASAHLEGVDSELVVPANHFEVHHHPLAILEVRRVLLEHLREVDTRLSGLQRVAAP